MADDNNNNNNNNKSPHKSFHQGQIIFKEGQAAKEAYLVKTGEVAIFRIVDNKRVILEHLRSGDILGEMGVVANQPRSTNAMAVEYSELLAIDKTTIDRAMEESPKIIQKITERVINRLAATNQQLRPHQPLNLFLSVCHFLKLKVEASAADPMPKPAGLPDGIPYQDLVATAKDILGLSLLEVEAQIKRLRSLKIVELNFTRRKGQLWDCYVNVPHPEKMMDMAKGFVSEVADTGMFQKNDQEFIDLLDFSRLVECKPEVLLKKIGAGEIPLSLMFMPKLSAEDYAADMGHDFFRKVKKLTSRFADMSGVDDIVEVDDDTLQMVFSQLGYSKLVTLYNIAGPAAQDKILTNLSRSTARIVRDEATMRPVADREEAEDVEYEAITLIKRAKGVVA